MAVMIQNKVAPSYGPWCTWQCITYNL